MAGPRRRLFGTRGGSVDEALQGLSFTRAVGPRRQVVELTGVRQVVNYPHQFSTIDGRYLHVRLGPGAGGRLEIGLDRFVNQPTYNFPWH